MSARLNLAGQIFGRWTVLSYDERSRGGGARWLCRCSCGATKIVKVRDLRTGDSKSCGCLKRQSSSYRMGGASLTGQRFYRLTVLHRQFVPSRRPGRYWVCRCDCGSIRSIRTSHLKDGRIKSCGCWSRDVAKSRVGAAHQSWKGGRRIDSLGYVMVMMKGHPHAKKNGYVLEHVLKMSARLGRPLLPHETVHHKNGIRSDNADSNLELMTSIHPSGQRVADMVEFCIEYLKQYAPEALAREAA